MTKQVNKMKIHFDYNKLNGSLLYTFFYNLLKDPEAFRIHWTPEDVINQYTGEIMKCPITIQFNHDTLSTNCLITDDDDLAESINNVVSHNAFVEPEYTDEYVFIRQYFPDDYKNFLID